MGSQAWTRWLGTGLGVIGGFILGLAMVDSSGIKAPGSIVILTLTTLEGLIFTYLGTPYVMGGWRRVNRSLMATPLPDLLSGLLGMIVGLVLAVLIGYFVRDFPYGVGLSAVLALLLAVTGATLGLTRRTELMAFVGGSEQPTTRRIKAAVLDTSVIIDGRILDVARTGFLDIPLVLTRSVLKELQYVADSPDPMRRGRGRRGLDVLTELQKEGRAVIEFVDDDTTGSLEIDARLVRLAKKSGYAIITNDFNLNRVAGIEGVGVLNLNELANAMKQVAVVGEQLTVLVVKEGKEAGQGVGYLDDGTMVVVDNARRVIGRTVEIAVTSVLQTASGKMIFGKLDESAARAEAGRAVELSN
jgi:uncharacterized protein YacL